MLKGRTLLSVFFLLLSLQFAASATAGCINNSEDTNRPYKLYTEMTPVLGTDISEGGIVRDSSLVATSKITVDPSIFKDILFKRGLDENQEVRDVRVYDSRGNELLFYPTVPSQKNDCGRMPACFNLTWDSDSIGCYEVQYKVTQYLKNNNEILRNLPLHPYPFDSYSGNYAYNFKDTQNKPLPQVDHKYKIVTKNIDLNISLSYHANSTLCYNISVVVPQRSPPGPTWTEDYSYYEAVVHITPPNYKITDSNGTDVPCDINTAIPISFTLSRPFFPTQFLFFLMVLLAIVQMLAVIFNNKEKEVNINNSLPKLYFGEYHLLESFLAVELIDTFLTFPARPTKISIFELPILLPMLVVIAVVAIQLGLVRKSHAKSAARRSSGGRQHRPTQRNRHQ